MNILVHASLDKKQQMLQIKDYLEKETDYKIILPELKRYQHIRDDYGDDVLFTKIKNQLTWQNINNVENCDVLLILNYSHRGIENYVGGNSFLEMVIAFYLKKKIILINPIPEGLPYTEEIKALYPSVISIDNLIKELDNL